MGLFDIFSGKPAKDAANKTRGFLDQTQGENLGYIDDGQSASLANIGSGYTLGRQALSDGYTNALRASNGGYDAARGSLNGGMDLARNAYASARSAFDPLADLGLKYGKSTDLYQDSLGVNGAEGNARAQSAFTPSLNYSFTLDQNLEAINRARNARGMANSGNTDRDAQEYGQGLASKELGTWQDRLAGFMPGELSATSGAATGRSNVDLQLAQAEQGHGQNLAGLDTGRAGMLTGLATQYGNNYANTYTGEGTSLAAINSGAAGARVGSNNAMIAPYAGTYKNEADAQMAGSKNMWGLGMGLASLGTSAFGGGGLGSMFGAGASAANQGVAGGGYVGAGGQIYPGPGYMAYGN